METEIEENKNILSNKWILWYHHVNDDNWTEDSYLKLCEIETIEDFWKMINTIDTHMSGMFFMMKEDIFPRWEDINNMDGGYWSFRIMKKDTDQIWQNLLVSLIGNTLTNNIEDMKYITGVSISPKINNCIIKIWNNDGSKGDIKLLNPNVKGLNFNESFYKKHQK